MNNIRKEQLKLYAITDRSWLGNATLYEQVEQALKGGATMVQLREKQLDEDAVEGEAEEILAVWRKSDDSPPLRHFIRRL